MIEVIKCIDIEWDLEGAEDMIDKLPTEIEVNLDDVDEFLDDDITEDNSSIIADYLEDQYGFSVITFYYQFIR